MNSAFTHRVAIAPSRWISVCRSATSRVQPDLFFLPPDLYPKTVQIDVFALLRLAGSAAINRQPQVRPETRLLTGHVEAVGVHIGFQKPAPASAFIFARVARFFLPAFER